MKRILGLATLTTALLLPLAPASAETDVARDARRDVSRVTYDAKTGDFRGSRPDPSETRADITRFQTTYGRRLLTIRITVRELGQPVRRGWSGGFATIVTPGRDYNALFSRRGKGLSVELSRSNGRSQDCRGLEGELLPRRNSLRFTVPAECLASPRWVRTGARMGYELHSALPDSWTDDARATGHRRGNVPVLGPRIQAG